MIVAPARCRQLPLPFLGCRNQMKNAGAVGPEEKRRGRRDLTDPPAGWCSSLAPRWEMIIRSRLIAMVGVCLRYIVTDTIWVVVVVVVIRVMVGVMMIWVMIIWVAVIIDLLDV